MHDAKYLTIASLCDNIFLLFSRAQSPSFSSLFLLFFLAFSRCLRTYFQLLCCASIRFRASPKHTLGRSDFVRLVENDLLIAEKTSSAGVLGVLQSRVFSILHRDRRGFLRSAANTLGRTCVSSVRDKDENLRRWA